MLTHPTLDLLHELGLEGCAKGFKDLAANPAAATLDHAEWLGVLLEHEVTRRNQKLYESRARRARLRHLAVIEDVDYRAARGLDKALFLKLGSCAWIREHRNLIVTGPCGVGKTWLACALGNQACRENLSVLYVRASRLFAELTLGRGDGRYTRLLRGYGKADLLVIDDWGPEPLGADQRRDLLEIVEERYGRKSLLITSQVPVADWHAIIGNPTLGDAILDRIVHNAYRIELSGDFVAQTQTRNRAEMTDTRRPAPAGAGRRVQPRLDESLTGSVSHEMSTSDLSAAMPGRHQIGTVAGFGLECWPTSRRNGGRLPVGITGRLRRNTQSMPTAATRISSSPMCRRSIWMASRSSFNRSLASHSRSFALDRATNLRDIADFDVPSPRIDPTSPPGSRTERRNLQVEMLISIWFIAHWPSQSSSCAAAQLGSTSSCWPSPLRIRGRSTPTPMKGDRAPGLAASHAADGARRTAPPLPPAEVPEALRSRRSGRTCRSFSELPRSHGRPVVRHRGWI